MESTSEERPNKVIIPVFIISIIIIILIVLILFINKPVSITPKANDYNSSASVSIDNSYVFASPVRAKTGGDLIRVTVFVLDSYGRGVADKKVSINGSLDLDISSLQATTDDTGKAMFDVGSTKPGSYTLEVNLDNLKLNQKVKLVFD